MQEHIRVGKEYPTVDNHTTYCFGLDDQEFVVAFDTDDAGAFLDLVQRLRTTESSAWTERDTPELHVPSDVGGTGARRDRRPRDPGPRSAGLVGVGPRPSAGTAAPVAFDPQEALDHLRKTTR